MDINRIIAPDFWRMQLNDRMKVIAKWREEAPFMEVNFFDPFLNVEDRFYTVFRYQELIEISKDPKVFCSGKGSISIVDMPTDLMEFFGSFIVMDDPRHARQRSIVSRAFTPRALQNVLDSVIHICNEVIDGFCEVGEVDFVESFSQKFPLLVICDMMGIPRSEFDRVLKATNVILGSGDPDLSGVSQDKLFEALIEAGESLSSLMHELAKERKKHPTDDLTSALITADLGEDMLTPAELASFFILLAVAGNDTTRNAFSHGMNFLSTYRDQRDILASDIDGNINQAVEEIVRFSSPVTFMRRTVTQMTEISGHKFSPGDKIVLFYVAANRDPRHFDEPEEFIIRRNPNDHVGFGGPGPHFCLGAHLARRELNIGFSQLLKRLPDIECTENPTMLDALGVPLVGGIKRLPVRFSPQPKLS